MNILGIKNVVTILPSKLSKHLAQTYSCLIHFSENLQFSIVLKFDECTAGKFLNVSSVVNVVMVLPEEIYFLMLMFLFKC